MAKSFWKIPPSEELPPAPVSLLKQQAAALAELTDGDLIGFVSPSTAPSGYTGFDLGIRVPLVNNYVYMLLSIEQPALMYPLRLDAPILDLTEEIENKDQLEAALAKILGSAEVERLVAALRAQAKAFATPS